MGHAVGIDLGTTNSVVAAVVDGKVQIIRDTEGNRLHPSIVGFVPNGDVLVGHPAAARRLVDPQNTIYSAKRLIGQRFKNPMVQMAVASVPYLCEEGENQQAVICLRRGKKMTVPEISGVVLRYLKRCSEIQLGGEVTEAVITVPANFTDSQRQATKLAGELAGLNVLRVINEPTAAALAYGYGLSLDSKIAVFDLGGGTFDVTVLQVHDKVFEVLSTGGDPFLGGDDFDKVLIDRLAHDFLRTTRYDAKADPDALSKLRAAAEQIKIRLSTDDAVAGTVHDLAQGVGGADLGLDFEVRRDEFERLISGYVEAAVRKCREVLTASGTQASELTDLILVGGSTRVPYVRRCVAEAFGREPQTKVNPDETVAYGAAIQASSMATAAKSPGRVHALLLDVCPRGLGIKVAGGYNELIIEKNTPVPVERTRTFSTSKDMQEQVTLEISQGEERQFSENETLGVLSLTGLPPRPRGQCKIEVTFTIDADGILAVRAVDQDTGAETVATIRVVGAPTEDERQATEPPPIPGGAPPAVLP